MGKKKEQLRDELASVRQQLVEANRRIKALESRESGHGQAKHVDRQNVFLESVLESITNPLCVIDAEEYTVVMANRAAAMFGTFAEATTCYALTHNREDPCVGADHVCPLKEVKRLKQPITVEHIHYDAQGNARHVETHGYPILNDEGNVAQMIEYTLDITERKEAEEEAKWLAKFPAENPYPVLRIANDCTIIYANDASSPLLKVWGRKVNQRLPEHWQVVLSEVFGSNTSKEVEVDVEDRVVSLTFAPVAGTDYANVYGLDITERKRAEEEIRRLSRVIEQSPSSVVITDILGTISYVNPKFTQVTGYTADEVLGKNPRILKSGAQPERTYAKLWETILAGQEWRGEFANKRKSGEIYWELASISPVRNTDGETISFVKVAEDITERKQAEEALQRYAAELEARNEELDTFAHTAAHDLKNPLGLIIGYADILADILNEDCDDLLMENLEKYVHAMARNGRRMNRIIDELLLLASVRQEDVTLEPLEMAHVVVNVQQRLADMIDRYQPEIVMPETWPTAMGYGPWVEEVWVNYMDNAIKYGGQPPRIELGAEEQPDGMARFWVRDNGPGLTPEEQSRLFSPFTRLDQAQTKGHGLGLSIVRRIVEKLGGEVGVESEVGHGSTFTFTLPGETIEK